MSRYERLPFAQFKEGYGAGGGYQPAWVGGGSEDDPDAKIITMDLICYFRLTDRKVRFLEVEYGTQEELDYIRAWVAREMESMFAHIRNTLADLPATA